MSQTLCNSGDKRLRHSKSNQRRAYIERCASCQHSTQVKGQLSFIHLQLQTELKEKRILIRETIGNRKRKRDCAWGCAWGIDTTWENLQIEKHKSVRWTERTPSLPKICTFVSSFRAAGNSIVCFAASNPCHAIWQCEFYEECKLFRRVTFLATESVNSGVRSSKTNDRISGCTILLLIEKNESN